MQMWTQNKVTGLAGVVVATALLMGGCSGDGILGDIGSIIPPATPKPSTSTSPTIRFIQPATTVRVQQGATINLQWADTHPAGAVTVQLFYDRDGTSNTGDEQTITILTESAATAGGTYAWNTTGIASNVYRLAAVIDDQVHPAVTTYLAYEIVILPKTNTQPETAEMTLKMLKPATDQRLSPGQSAMITWQANDPTGKASLYLYYDLDVNPINDNKSLIAVLNPGDMQVGDRDYGWTIPVGLQGTYNILGRLTNGVDPDLFAYAPGSIVLGGGVADAAQRDMADVGRIFSGFTFEGYVPYGRLGDVMAGGKNSNGQSWDYDGDGYSDFVLVAPKVLSQIYAGIIQPDGRTGVGEAYLIYSRGAAGRWPQQGAKVSIGNITGFSLEGVKFVGPAFTNSSAGIQDAMFLEDVDGDSRPELLFSTSDINGVVEDQQDYDPLDSDQIHAPGDNVPPGWPQGMYYYQCPGWQVFSDQPSGLVDGISLPNRNRAPEEMRSGLVAWVSSQSQGTIRNGTVLMDEIAGQAILFSQVQKIRQADGMKVFPNAGGDDSGWGARLGQSKFFGERDYPSVLVARPNHAGGAGSVKVMPHAQMVEVTTNWTTRPPPEISDFETAINAFTFPGADTTGGDDPDRNPEWPYWWYRFMDPLASSLPNRVLPQPSEFNFDIINRNAADAADGHMTNPTGLRDFDGDTIEDLAVAMPDSAGQMGLAYVVYGNNAFVGADVSRFATSTGTVRGFELRGTQIGEQLGFKMAGPGNVTRDASAGKSEWLLTAPQRDWAGRVDCGAVILVPGQPQLGSFTVDDVLPNLKGAILYGSNAGDKLGTYLAAVGDVDRDGYQDFLVSAPGYSDLVRGRAQCGAVYLLYGGPHLEGEFDISDIGTSNLPGKIYIGPETNAAIGPVSGAGDTDSDNFDDFLIAQPNAITQITSSGAGLLEAGKVWLVYGSRREAP